MNTYTPGTIATAKQNSPAIVRDFIDSPDFKKIIIEISQKSKLNLGGTSELIDLVTAVLLGLEPQHALPENIAHSNMHLSSDGQRALITEIDTKIFQEIKNRMQNPQILESNPARFPEEA